MTQQQIIEIIKRHAPELTEAEIRSRLKDTSDMFCEETHILTGQWSFNTTPEQMYYDIDDRCVAINEVNYAGEISDIITNVRNIRIGR